MLCASRSDFCRFDSNVSVFVFFFFKIYFADHLFDQDCSNGRVYELLIKDIINAAIEGFNGAP